jgi:hypothetical protein
VVRVLCIVKGVSTLHYWKQPYSKGRFAGRRITFKQNPEHEYTTNSKQ